VHRLFLFSHEDYPPSPLADLLQQLVTADSIAGLFNGGSSMKAFDCDCGRRLLQKPTDSVMRAQQRFDRATQFLIPTAGAIKEGRTRTDRQAQGLGKDHHIAGGIGAHGKKGLRVYFE
jgi:hypothetical protein